MQQQYELYFIINPELSADQVESTIDLVSGLITKELGAQNVQIQNEGVRKLAYPIKKHRTGLYVNITFTCDEKPRTISNVERKLNINDDVLRYILINQTKFLEQAAKQRINTSTEITTHRALNKGKEDKKCIVKHLGYRVIDYKDVDFLSQFVSPYAKIFPSKRTGTSSKYQRKIKKAIKRARHMALMPFTPKYSY